eukprot:796382-Amphidinium_carterae.1
MEPAALNPTTVDAIKRCVSCAAAVTIPPSCVLWTSRETKLKLHEIKKLSTAQQSTGIYHGLSSIQSRYGGSTSPTMPWPEDDEAGCFIRLRR